MVLLESLINYSDMEIIDFCDLISRQVLVLDGGIGTMIQRFRLSEEDFKGVRFAAHKSRLLGCNDILCITRPDIIKEIHNSYLNAGADIISTDTFNANAISLADYDLHSISGLVREINRTGAKIARDCAETAARRSWGGHALVAGSIGPTNKSATMSPDVADPAARNVTFDELYTSYLDQIIGLIEGGVDILLFETVFDTLNLKAGLDAANYAMRKCGRQLPIMVSATISDKSGRTLSGQTLSAFVTSIEEYAFVVSLGLNCSFGPKDIIPYVRELGKVSSKFISTHPNAGLPDALGEYNVAPDDFIVELRPLLEDRLVNIVGGCCGTTPAHIAALRKAVDMALPYKPHLLKEALRVSGLERVEICKENNFLVVGERCNVAGSRKFLRLIKEKNYGEALRIAAKQVEDGARILDINMDDPLLDAPEEMTHFLRLYASDPEVAKVPVMVDSSDWSVVKSALKNLQGKSIVNSISLKEGEETFIKKARRIRELGASVIVMAFDEKGQADNYERKIEVCGRAYRLLTEECGYVGDDIIFDVNVMAVATGLEEHFRYGIDFIDAVRWIKKNLPGARTSGGISNLSFAFRGKNALREAIHTVFLYHAIAAGLDMAIMNPAASLAYEDIDDELRTLIEDVVLARRAESSDLLVEYAAREVVSGVKGSEDVVRRDLDIPVAKRLEDAIVAGRPENIAGDLDEMLSDVKAVDIVEGPLMDGMKRVGVLFGEGKMFLPQVVKTARVMKMAVDHLEPYLLESSTGKGDKNGKILIATVKGDVHDIGKNIVSIVLTCNNFDVIDLGVMVAPEDIVSAALEHRPDIICLSGLITPSLAEMAATAKALKGAGLSIPLLVGGATTSALHTALKLAPVYDGPVVHMKDASQNPVVAAALLSSAGNEDYILALKEEQSRLRKSYEISNTECISLEEARKQGAEMHTHNADPIIPKCGVGKMVVKHFSIEEIIPFVNWKMFLHAWAIHDYGCACGCDSNSEARRLLEDARKSLDILSESGKYDGFGLVKIVKAKSDGDNIILNGKRIPVLRQQHVGSGYKSIADYIDSELDYVGIFMVGAGTYIDAERKRYEENGDSYKALLFQSLADRLAEASSEYLHFLVRKEYWGYAPDETMDVKRILRGEYRGIRPAMGYPMMPDQLLNKDIYDILQPESGKKVVLTENGAMSPTATVSGLYIANPDAKYFTLPKISEDQISDYAYRRSLSPERISEILNL